MAAPNQFQAPVVAGFEALRVTEREVEIRLCLVLRQVRDAAVVRPAADSVTVPRAARIARRPRQQLVVIEIDPVAAEAHPLQLEHLRVREDVHQERDVSRRKILRENTMLPQRLHARLIVRLRYPLASSEGVVDLIGGERFCRRRSAEAKPVDLRPARRQQRVVELLAVF